MTESYLQAKRRREACEEQKGEIVFGLLGGFLLLVLGVMNNWPIDRQFGFFTVMSYVFIAAGLCFILVAVVVPALLKWPYKGFVFLGRKIGGAVLMVLLTVIYGLIVLPVGLLFRHKRKQAGFYSWTGSFPYKDASFETMGAKEQKGFESPVPAQLPGKIYMLFETLVRNKRVFLIPAAVLLILLGLILFFAASNIVFNFFIYTLF